MMITEKNKRVIPFSSGDAKRIGARCFYLDQIIWLNGQFVEMGDDVGFNYGCYINGLGTLTIGDRTIFGPYTMIHTANHRMDVNQPIQGQGWVPRAVVIGKDSWIGMGTMILPGVSIGDGVVIGAGSVVTRDIPSHTVAAGNPCKVIRQRK